jgi:transcriptional regulator with XRE-family HTH domain
MFHVRNNLVGKRVKLARKLSQPHLTQKNLAEKLQLEGCDIDRVTIAKIEMGLRQVTDFEVKALSKVLNVSIEWLFQDSN